MKCVDASQRSATGCRTMNIIKGRAKATALFMTCLALYYLQLYSRYECPYTAIVRPFIKPQQKHNTAWKRCPMPGARWRGESRIMPPFKAPMLITEQSITGRPYRTCDSRSSTVSNRMKRNKTICQKASLVLTIQNSESILHVRLSMWRQNRLLRAPAGKATLNVRAVADVATRNDTRVSWFYIVSWQLF